MADENSGTRTSSGDAAPRRSKRRRSKVAEATVLEALRSPRAGRRIAAAMAVATIFYIGFSYHRFSNETLAYGDLWVGATPAEIVYYEGSPSGRAAAGDGATLWRYDTGPQHLLLAFAGERTRTVACGQLERAGDCPPALGFSTGDSELDLYRRLGTPSRERIEDGLKLMAYDSLGYSFLLERGEIRRILLSAPSGAVGDKVLRYVRWVTP